MIVRALKKGIRVVRNVARAAKGVVVGPQGPGYGVSEYEDFERIRKDAAAQDVREGVVTAGSEMDSISDGTTELDAEALRVMLEVALAEDLPDLIDVREPHEWAGGHIPGAIHVPLGQLDVAAHSEIDRNKKVVVYCASGMRSIDGSYTLKRAGFARVYSLAGGIHAWAAAGGEIVIPGPAQEKAATKKAAPKKAAAKKAATKKAATKKTASKRAAPKKAASKGS